METLVSVTGTPSVHEELASLHDWLVREDAYRGQAHVVPVAEDADVMGPALEVLTVTVELGGLAALTDTIAVWLQTRRSELAVTVTDADGSAVEITAKGKSATSLAKKLDLDG